MSSVTILYTLEIRIEECIRREGYNDRIYRSIEYASILSGNRILVGLVFPFPATAPLPRITLPLVMYGNHDPESSVAVHSELIATQ